MRFFKSLILVLAIFFFIFVSGVNAGILWEKELVLDANTNSAPLASCLNKDGNGIIVMTLECPKGSFPIKGDNILWKIGADGNVIRILPKNTDGSKVYTKPDPAGNCAIASDSLGNLLTIGMLDKQKDEKERKVAVISKADKAEKIMSPLNSINSHSIKQMIPLQDNTFFLVGDQNSGGLCMRLDGQGKIMREKLLDIGQTAISNSVDQMKSNSNLVIAGASADITVKNSTMDFVILCDTNCKIINEDYFAGGFPGVLLPKVCCLNNGNIVVVYKKEDADANKTLVSARCYTQELKFLWEKEVFATNKLLLSFDVMPRNLTDFVVGTAGDNLEFYFFDKDGMRTDYIQYRSTLGSAFGVAGFNLISVNDKTIAVFEEGTAGNIKECTIKAKVIALE